MNLELRDGVLRPLLDAWRGKSGDAVAWPGPAITGSLDDVEEEERWIWNALPQAFVGDGAKPVADLEGLPNRVATLEGDVVTVRHPLAFVAEFSVAGVAVRMVAESDLPFGRVFRLRLEPSTPVEFTLRLALPHWADDTDFDVPDSFGELEYDEGFVVLRRVWSEEDAFEVTFHAEPRWTISTTGDRAFMGRVALVHGPLVYALRAQELKADPGAFAVLASEEITLEEDGALYVQGLLDKIDPQPYTAFVPYEGEETTLEVRLVPFLECAQLNDNQMQVWLRKL